MKGFLKVMKRSTLVMFFSMGAFFFCTGMTKADAATYTKKVIPVYDNKQTDPTSINCLFSEDMPNVPSLRIVCGGMADPRIRRSLSIESKRTVWIIRLKPAG